MVRAVRQALGDRRRVAGHIAIDEQAACVEPVRDSSGGGLVESRLRDEQAGTGVTEQRRERRGPEERAHGNHYGADLGRRRVEREQLEPIGEERRQSLSRSDTLLEEDVRRAVDQRAERGPVEAGVAEDHSRARRTMAGVAGREIADQHGAKAVPRRQTKR